MTALHPAPVCPAGANRHLELADDHLRDRQLFLSLRGHAYRTQRAPAIRTGRRQRSVVPFIDPPRLPPAGRDTIAGTCRNPLTNCQSREHRRRPWSNGASQASHVGQRCF